MNRELIAEKARQYWQIVGGKTRETEIWMDAQTSARNSLYERKTSSSKRSKIQVIALQEWLETIQRPFDLLKMDCEKAEWQMLKATPTSFTRFPIIVAEIHRNPNGSQQMKEFIATLSQCGVRTVSCDGLYIGQRHVASPSQRPVLSNQAS